MILQWIVLKICVSRHSKLITITFGCFECTLTSLGSQYIREANVSYTFELRVTHMLSNGFNESKIVMGCSSTNFDGYDNYFELNKIKKKYNMGGAFIKYFHNSPYKWDISALLSINSK
jgi:hypothetical protein